MDTTAEMLRNLVHNMDCLDEDSPEQIVFIHQRLAAIKAQNILDYQTLAKGERYKATKWLESF